MTFVKVPMRHLLRPCAHAILAIASTVVFLTPSAVDAQGADNLDPLLRARATQLVGRSRVIVEFRDAPDVRVLTRDGGIAGRTLQAQHAQVADVRNQSLAEIAQNPAVLRVLPDRDAFATMERTGAAVGATMARQEFGLSGRGIGIAVIDSGVAAWVDDLSLANPTAPRVSTRVVHFKDFTHRDNPRVWFSERPTDDMGHGTHVAGIIAGSGFDSNGRRTGIAPRANLIALKVLDAQGHGYISDVIDAIDYAIAVRFTYNIRVINLSVAAGVFESYRTDPLAQAARRAVRAGIVVVAAAGNLGANSDGRPQFGGITCPGNAPWVLTVGAASHQGTIGRSDDIVPDFTSRGPTWIDFTAKPDLIAYGVGTESLAVPHSTLYQEYPGYLLAGTRRTPYKPYLSLTGTSMSAPVVAGTVALMIEANPHLTPNAVKALLQYTAEVRTGAHVLTQGAGLLNASGAIRMARFFAAPGHALPTPDDQINSEHIVWSRHILWGNALIDGGFPLPGSSAWDVKVTWGDAHAANGKPVVWGVNDDENIVWSTDGDDNIVWSVNGDENIVWSTDDDDNIVWSVNGDENIVWSTDDEDNIVWSTAHVENVVWGNDCGGKNCQRTVWGAAAPDGTLWGTSDSDDNIVWSTDDDDNIVWSTDGDDNIVWSTAAGNQTLWPAAPVH